MSEELFGVEQSSSLGLVFLPALIRSSSLILHSAGQILHSFFTILHSFFTHSSLPEVELI